jgi:hypothetical protein
MQDHIEDQLQIFESEIFVNKKGEIIRLLAYTNILNTLAKLQKYNYFEE